MRLREIRKSRNISQTKLAIDLNTTQNTISRWENGLREPGIEELISSPTSFEKEERWRKTSFFVV